MIEYAIIAPAVVSGLGAGCAGKIADYARTRLPRKHKSAAKLIGLLAAFIGMAYFVADMAIAIHQSGAPTIYFLPVLVGSTFFYVHHFRQNLRKIRAIAWRFWYKYVFVISCIALAPVAYFLLAFSILELQYNTINWL